MTIFKDIWNTLFGKSKQEKQFGRGGSIAEPEMKIVHKKSEEKIELGATYTENELGEPNPQVCNDVQKRVNVRSDDFFVSNDLIEKETKTDAKFINPIEKAKNKKVKNIVGQKTLNEIKEYLITYGSIDVLTCEQKFKVKSLHNFIWFLRNEGFEIKTDKVGLHNELGQKVEVTNYRLIAKT
jgi:hypothetical protein